MSTVKRYDFTNKLEIWGGLECTINRVGNEFRDQLDYTGHYDRKGDIEKFVKLGICAIRYPVLWEFHQPNKNVPINWKWAARQLNLIRQNNITPIVGLVHHGSGPKFTDLLDPNFPVDLASYATQVAKRFPWIEYYTPVNEPLTTARFSGLYGLWYPHHNNDLSFARILLNEVKAIVLSMQVIREINPFAKLVQTEDLAKIHSTPLLQYQADFENERRWLTYDLLYGLIFCPLVLRRKNLLSFSKIVVRQILWVLIIMLHQNVFWMKKKIIIRRLPMVAIAGICTQIQKLFVHRRIRW